MKTIEDVKKAALNFLNLADEVYQNVENYLSGSNNKKDIESYYKVKELNGIFIQAYNEYYGEHLTPSLDYELAESFMPLEYFED